MTRWFVSDLHFGHRNVISYCKRPFNSVEEMDVNIIKQWNSQVRSDDVVYFLGDFGISKRKCLDESLVGSLNGKKIMILGNHDYGFSRLQTGRNVDHITNSLIQAGWDGVSIYSELTLKNGQSVTLTHLPPDNSLDSRYSDYKITNCPALVHLHGHLHGWYRKKGNMIDVAFDSDLKLLSEDDIISLIDDERDLIETRLTNKYKTEKPPELIPYDEEVHKGYIRRVEKDGLVLYNYTDKCTYDKSWNKVTKSARGIIFEKGTGNLVALPFSKFFNINEVPETQLNYLPNESFTVTEKMDGSLGILYFYNKKWNVATRGSFSSDQALKAEQILKKYDMSEVPTELTIMVEIIYPENKIVSDYGSDEKLVLLAANNVETKEEASRRTLELIHRDSGMPLVKQFDYTIEDMIDLKKVIPFDEEGYVVRFESGMRVKIKGDEYLRVHKMISSITPLSFWESMVDGKVRVNFLKEIPEEFRYDSDILKIKLEQNYKKKKYEVLHAVDCLVRNIGFGSMADESYRKKVGLYVKTKPIHHKVMFPALLNRHKDVDKYIMSQIRPDNNKL